jgi:hypothetical protein
MRIVCNDGNPQPGGLRQPENWVLSLYMACIGRSYTNCFSAAYTPVNRRIPGFDLKPAPGSGEQR